MRKPPGNSHIGIIEAPKGEHATCYGRRFGGFGFKSFLMADGC